MADREKIQILKDALYEAARDHGSDQRLFTQRDLLDMQVIPQDNIGLLMQVIQILCDEKLFVGNTTASGLSWRWRSREDAKKCATTFLFFLFRTQSSTPTNLPFLLKGTPRSPTPK